MCRPQPTDRAVQSHLLTHGKRERVEYSILSSSSLNSKLSVTSCLDTFTSLTNLFEYEQWIQMFSRRNHKNTEPQNGLD